MVLFITKGSRDLQGICLVEVLCKTVTGILNRHLTTDIGFHNNLHEFWAGQGVGNAYLEDNMLQQLIEMNESVL